MKQSIQSIKLTHILVVINIILFGVTVLVAGIIESFAPGESAFAAALVLVGAEYLPQILNGQVWRLVLPAFLHGNLLHLAFNMWALSMIGIHVEDFYGKGKLFAVYVLSAIGGSLLSILITLGTALSGGSLDSNFPISIGASGAIFGLVGLLIGNNYKDSTYAPQIPVNTQSLWSFVIINLFIGFSGAFNINNSAHIGGLVTGFLLGLYLDPINSYYQSNTKKWIERILVWAAVIITLLSVIIHIPSILLFVSSSS